MSSARIIVHDHHPLFRRGLCDALSAVGHSCIEAESFNHLIRLLDEGDKPDLVLCDLRRSKNSKNVGHNYLRISCLRSRFPKQNVVAVTDAEAPAVVSSCIALGVAGCVLKSQAADEILQAVRSVLAGKTYVPPCFANKLRDAGTVRLTDYLRCLTGQESRVLMLLCDGLFNQQIADALGLTEATVKAHVSKVLRKLSVPNRTNAVVMIERLAEHAY